MITDCRGAFYVGKSLANLSCAGCLLDFGGNNRKNGGCPEIDIDFSSGLSSRF